MIGSQETEVVWTGYNAGSYKSFAWFVESFSDKAVATLNVLALVPYPGYVLYFNCSKNSGGGI